MARLHFLRADSLLAIASKGMRPDRYASDTINKARDLDRELPMDPHSRRAALRDFAKVQQESLFSDSEKFGICPVFFRLAAWVTSNNQTDHTSSLSLVNDHLKTCKTCQRLEGEQNVE